jgi:hypothetical protein
MNLYPQGWSVSGRHRKLWAMYEMGKGRERDERDETDVRDERDEADMK